MNGKMIILACITGFLLDCIFGDPVWMYHPIRVIGNLISVLEKGLRKLLCSRIHASEQEKKNIREVLAGGILWILTVSLSFLVPTVLLFAAGKVHPAVRFLLETFWCYQIYAATPCHKSIPFPPTHVQPASFASRRSFVSSGL